MPFSFTTNIPMHERAKIDGYGYESGSCSVHMQNDVDLLNRNASVVDMLQTDGFDLNIIRVQFANIPITTGHKWTKQERQEALVER